jgi:hypothetical protein
MTIDQPCQTTAEEATAHLLHMALIQIRFLAAPLVKDQSHEALLDRRDRIHELADICHNLPRYPGPERRHRLLDELRYTWCASSESMQ